jgi:outer membrane cobalamin receptor
MNYKFTARVPAALLSIFISCSAVAEEAIDEIIVTADFRGRPASELPSSVSIIDASIIEEAAVQHFEELVNIVPNRVMGTAPVTFKSGGWASLSSTRERRTLRLDS